MKTPETLYPCPVCGGGNFTKAGLRAHKNTSSCLARARAVEAEKSDSAEDEHPMQKVGVGMLATGPKRRTEAEQVPLPHTATADLAPAVVEPESEQDAAMGAQLAEAATAYEHGEQDQKMRGLFLGAMGLKLRTHIHHVSARGHVVRNANGQIDRSAAKGTGLKGWLEKYAPTVPRSALYDWMAIAEGVQSHFRLAENVDLKALMCGSQQELEPKLAKVADRIRKYLDGKSRRQLELQFANRSTGGKRERSAEPTERDPVDEAVCIWTPLLTQLAEEGLQERSWMHLPKEMQDRLDGLLIDISKARKGAK